MFVVSLLSVPIACIVEQYVWLSSLGLSPVHDWAQSSVLVQSLYDNASWHLAVDISGIYCCQT